MANPDDRRAKRSRRLLKQGLVELLREKRFTEISVRDIAERMDLNRGTFYLHYPDTYTLLQSLEADALRDAQAMIDQHRQEITGDTLRPIFAPLLDYIVENQDLCRSLFVNNASSDFVGRVDRLIYENGAGIIRSRYPDAPEERMEYLLRFLSFGLIGLIKNWFDQGMRTDKDEIVTVADRMAVALARELFEKE